MHGLVRPCIIYIYDTLTGLVLAASAERSSATQFHVRHILCATANAENVNSLTLMARENSSKRLIHFHKTAENSQHSTFCYIYTFTICLYILTKDRVYNDSIILSRLECYMKFSQFTLFFRRERENASRFRLQYSKIHISFEEMYVDNVGEKRKKKLCKHNCMQGEIYVTGISWIAW